MFGITGLYFFPFFFYSSQISYITKTEGAGWVWAWCGRGEQHFKQTRKLFLLFSLSPTNRKRRSWLLHATMLWVWVGGLCTGTQRNQCHRQLAWSLAFQNPVPFLCLRQNSGFVPMLTILPEATRTAQVSHALNSSPGLLRDWVSRGAVRCQDV